MLAPGVFGNWRGDADTEAISRIVCTHVFVHYTASSEDLQLRMKAWIEGLEWHQAWNSIGILSQGFHLKESAQDITGFLWDPLSGQGL